MKWFLMFCLIQSISAGLGFFIENNFKETHPSIYWTIGAVLSGIATVFLLKGF